MTKEDFINIGYVNFGYISPELSSEDVYPSYIKDNVKQAIEKIKKAHNNNCISFVFMTDLHYSTTPNHDIRTKRLMNALDNIKNETGIDTIILGGDYVNDGTKEYKLKNYRALRSYFKDRKWFPVNGNHDDNSIWDLCIESEVSTHHLTTAELYEEFYSHLPALGTEFNKEGQSLYYFLDDKNLKVRYIFIDSNDIPYSVDKNGKLNYTKQHTFALSQSQVDWLCNKALVFDEDSWDIVFLSHAFKMFEKESDELQNLDVLNDIIDAYQKGETINKSYYENEFKLSVCTDFSKQKRGKILACFAGHHHADFEEYSESGIPFIYTGNVIMYKYAVPRIDGDKSELLFDVVTIDREKRLIYTTRIGAGKDRQISF